MKLQGNFLLIRICSNKHKDWLCVAERAFLGDVIINRIKFFQLKEDTLEVELRNAETDSHSTTIEQIVCLERDGEQYFISIGKEIFQWGLQFNLKTESSVN